MEFPRPECWSGWPFPAPGDRPDPGKEPGSPALQVDSLPTELLGKPIPHTWALLYFLKCTGGGEEGVSGNQRWAFDGSELAPRPTT